MGSNREVSINLLLLAGLLLAAGWHFREDIRGRLFAPSRPAPITALVYSWTDQSGTKHFGQESPGHGSHVIVVNTGHITPLEPMSVEQLSQSPPGLTLASGVNSRSSGKGVAPGEVDMRANIEARATDDN